MASIRRAPQASVLPTVVAAGSRGPHAGTSYQRPPSQRVPGAAYYDTTLARFVDSTGALWQDRANVQVGNLLPANEALLLSDSDGWVPGGGVTQVRSRAVVPPGRTTALKLTATAATNVVSFVGTGRVVTSGATYSAFARRMRGDGPARSFYVSIYWYAGGTFLSATNGANAVTTPGAWAKSTVATGVAPATADHANFAAAILAAAVNEVFYLTEACLAPGVITDFIEP